MCRVDVSVDEIGVVKELDQFERKISETVTVNEDGRWRIEGWYES